MEGFDGPELVMGSIYGVRHFSWSSRGLGAVSHDYQWTTGENGAECRALRVKKAIARTEECVATHGDDHHVVLIDYLERNGLPHPPGVEQCYTVEYEERHTPGAPECGCGFWAYYGNGEGSPYANQRRIAGVIEGYGRTTLGTKGFRAEKAKVVALMVPQEKEPEPEVEPFDQKGMFKDEVRKYLLWSLLVVTLPWTLWNLWDIRGARRMHKPGECDDSRFTHGTIGHSGNYLWCTARLRHASRRDKAVIDAQNAAEPKSSRADMWTKVFLSAFNNSVWGGEQPYVPVDVVAGAYPDVPIFSSMDEMLREFPTERPEIAS